MLDEHGELGSHVVARQGRRVARSGGGGARLRIWPTLMRQPQELPSTRRGIQPVDSRVPIDDLCIPLP